MSTENTPALPVPLETKQKQWSNFAVVVHNGEMKLQVMKEAALGKLKTLPKDTRYITEYESTLAAAKKSKTEVVDERKLITAVFDKIAGRLMGSEKEFDPAILAYETALITVKQQAAKNAATVKAKADEVARIRETISNTLASQHADFETAIVNKVLAIFTHCLTQKMTPELVLADIPKMKGALTEKNFTHTCPPFTLGYVLQVEVDEIWNELHTAKHQPASSYLASYHGQLINKFEFYEVSLKNAEAAIDLENKSAATKIAEIVDEKADAEVAAKLDAIAPLTPIVESGGRALKQLFALDMEETQDNAIRIIAAFAANWSTVKDQLGVKKWFNLSVKQMAAGLVDLKNKDNKFAVSGITFKTIEKL